MPIDSDSTTCSSSNNDNDQPHEYYEELGNQTLDFQKRKVTSKVPEKKQSPPVQPRIIDPVQQLNERLNRQFRPDLVPPSLPPPVSSQRLINRSPSTPDPIIFDARAKPVKSSKKPIESTNSIKQNLFSRIHQLADSFHKSPPSPIPYMSTQQQTDADGFQVPAGMMLVPIPQQQQQQSVISQYKPPIVTNSNSFKHNKVAPPPSFNQPTQIVNPVFTNASYITPSSMLSTNQLIPTYNGGNQQMYKQQQNAFKHIEDSKSSKKKHKKHTDDDGATAKTGNRSFALYNQKNGRIEGVVKNRLNIATDSEDGSRIIDDEANMETKNKYYQWLSQPLCLGLTRFSGGILFGSMALLGCGSLAGLIVSIVLYTQDSVTDAQWKILGMVVCAIMLITIIITLLIFVCCYKHGYMFDQDEDVDPTDPSTTQDIDGNETQKAYLRKIYKFNRPNDVSSIQQNTTDNVSTSPLPQKIQSSVLVNDKLTNTDTTIAVIRPKDFDRGVWTSINAYGGVSYRPLIQPQSMSRFIQVLPHEIDELMQPQQVIYQVVAPAPVMPTTQIQQKIIQVPAPTTSTVVEYIETNEKQIQQQQQQQQPRIIQIPAQEAPVVEYIESVPKQSRTTIVRQPQTQQIIVQPSTTQIEYVDVADQRTHRVVQKPQYEIVEEVYDHAEASPIEEIVEIVDTTKRKRKKDKTKKVFGGVFVKHIRSND